MTNFDFSPLFRSSVGFDRLSRLFDEALVDDGVNYPPYNIEKTGDSAYRITMAVAGFGEDDINIVTQENQLTVSGKSKAADERTEYLYRGIAGRDFERRFQLADHVRVTGAKLANGLLTIDLKREIPEEKKARAIRIERGPEPRTITQQ